MPNHKGFRHLHQARDNAVDKLYESGLSTTQISVRLGWPASRVRKALLELGVCLRSRTESLRLASPRLSAAGRLRPRPPLSDEHKRAISCARSKWADENAAGIKVSSNGYRVFTRGQNKDRGEHTVLMEQAIGRHILPGEVVHHIDGIKTNNQLSNLLLMSNSAHTSLHRNAKS